MALLQMTSVDMQTSLNRKNHHTDEYQSSQLVLRRGQPFTIILHFSRALQAGEKIEFTVLTGSSASISNKTKAVFLLSSSMSSDGWSAFTESSDSSSMLTAISSPANALIGQYEFSMQISSAGRTSTKKLQGFSILFNPWLSDDDVYIPHSEETEEYVLNENGVIFQNQYSKYGRPWGYGQFEADILDICFHMLNRSLEYRQNAAADIVRRNDPKYISRVMSAMVNGNDDNGVLWGKWEGDFGDGVRPTSWNGSTDILRRWYRSGQPVKYGQCWVYAGVLCTVLRCLGIPTRVITNFKSAHDTNNNLIIDLTIDRYGKILDQKDSIWNFHVWNECWFTRNDLGAEYNGWQVLDATPQELSRAKGESIGTSRLGPASVRAIKEGDIRLAYDCPFVFAEMNADCITWVQQRDGQLVKSTCETRSVGRDTCTKAIGSSARVDVTGNYKYPEGSHQERQIFNKAKSMLRSSGFLPSRHMVISSENDEVPEKSDVTGKFWLEGTREIGMDVSIILALKNNSSNSKKVQAHIVAATMTYTGKPVHEIMTDSLSISLDPYEEKRCPLKICSSHYEAHLTEHNLIGVNAVCDDDIGRQLVVETSITLKMPSIDVKVNEWAQLNQCLPVEISFINPPAQSGSKRTLVVEGYGLMKEKLKIGVPALQTGKRFKTQFDIYPYRVGCKQLLINYDYNDVIDMKAVKNIIVSA